MKVAVIMGSDSDWDVMAPAVEVLKEFAIEYEVVVASAHRTPGKVHEFAEEAAGRGVGVIIAAAGAARTCRVWWRPIRRCRSSACR